jgi:hypothetical protein
LRLGNLRAVVFDANAFGHGRPDLAFLEDLARRLHTIDIETRVPEPVACERAHNAAGIDPAPRRADPTWRELDAVRTSSA